MKVLVVGTLMTLGVLVAIGQNTRAEVQELSGKEIYLLSEPEASYEVVASIKTAPKLTSLLTRGIYNEHVNDKATQFANRSIRKLDRKSVEFDALVYKEGKSVYAVKFREESEGFATVQEMDGLSVFILSSPVDNYEVKEQVKNGINIVPFLTYGWINNSIEKDITRYVKKANKSDDADAILYQSGRRASLIALD